MADDTEDDGEDSGPVVADSSTPPASSSAPTTPASPAASTKPAPDFDSMLVSPDKMEATRQRLLAIKQQEAASNARGAGEVNSRIDRDRARMEAAYNATAIGPDDLKPFDAAGKSAQYKTDPVEAFGSIGSVFAMLASGFTKAPMEAALNGGAAAINAIHAQDDKAYQRDFDAWKQNTDLALKRHEIQRQAYNDATNLMNSDINAGRTKMEMNARKFGDDKAIALLENGMDKELIDLQDSRDKAALSLKSQWDQVELQHEKVQDLRADPRFTSDDPAQKAAAVQDWTKRWSPQGSQQLKYDAVQDQIDQFKKEHRNYTYSELQTAISDASEAANAGKGRGGAAGAVQEEIERRTKEYQDGGMSQTDAYDKASAEVKKSHASKSLSVDELIKNSEADVAADKRDRPLTRTEATAQFNRQTAAPSGNRLDDINKQIDMYDNGLQAIDRTMKLIDKHVGAVGAAGYATRLGERLGNVAGSSETDRVQLAHDIQYLQTVAPRLMLDASSRGLKSEGDRIGQIIAGLNIGDTTANTKRALGEVRTLWAKMQQDNIARARGTPNQGGYGPGSANPEGKPPATKVPPEAPWRRDPIIGPRSESSSPDMAVG